MRWWCLAGCSALEAAPVRVVLPPPPLRPACRPPPRCLRRLLRKAAPDGMPAIYLDALKAAHARIQEPEEDEEEGKLGLALAWRACWGCRQTSVAVRRGGGRPREVRGERPQGGACSACRKSKRARRGRSVRWGRGSARTRRRSPPAAVTAATAAVPSASPCRLPRAPHPTACTLFAPLRAPLPATIPCRRHPPRPGVFGAQRPHLQDLCRVQQLGWVGRGDCVGALRSVVQQVHCVCVLVAAPCLLRPCLPPCSPVPLPCSARAGAPGRGGHAARCARRAAPPQLLGGARGGGGGGHGREQVKTMLPVLARSFPPALTSLVPQASPLLRTPPPLRQGVAFFVRVLPAARAAAVSERVEEVATPAGGGLSEHVFRETENHTRERAWAGRRCRATASCPRTACSVGSPAWTSALLAATALGGGGGPWLGLLPPQCPTRCSCVLPPATCHLTRRPWLGHPNPAADHCVHVLPPCAMSVHPCRLFCCRRRRRPL